MPPERQQKVLNYEGKELPPEQIEVFREMLESTWPETLGLPGGVRQWNESLLRVTEGRRTLKNPDGTTKVFYSSSGASVTYHLVEAGIG